MFNIKPYTQQYFGIFELHTVGRQGVPTEIGFFCHDSLLRNDFLDFFGGFCGFCSACCFFNSIGDFY
jgi:hypothetical protein